jgi:hypothetical protein
MDIRQKTEEIEKELLDIIIKHLQEKSIDMKTASKLADDFLKALPVQSQQDLLAKLKDLSVNYREARSIYQQELAKDIKTREEHALLQMQGAIRQGNIEHAISVAKSLRAN